MPARVSIITPSYNQASYLEQTLQSVLDQGYPELEYLVADGASNDGSVEIIRRYADRLAWWVTEKDSGQGEAINKGFSRASGEVVAWINSDDTYLPGAIAAAVQALESHPEVGLVYGDVVSVDGAGQPINVMTYAQWGLAELARFNIIGQSSVFLRRSVLQQAGLLDTSYHMLLDHHLWLRVARLAGTLYVPQRWSTARYHAEAKNLAQPVRFAQEAYRLAGWIESSDGLPDLYREDRRRIWAGARRFAARYLLDGSQPGPALRAYLQSLVAEPFPTLKEGRRIAYAAASLLFNLEGLKKNYLERRRKKLRL
jgi:glycosyltransferase involved in cell wall biosynthesis